jgi:hypothetical protein
VLEAILTRERPGVQAQIGRDRVPAAGRQQAFAQEQHDRDRAGDERDAHERELEVAEAAHAGVRRVGGGDHVHRGAGQGQERAGMRAERERDEELCRRASEAHGEGFPSRRVVSARS